MTFREQTAQLVLTHMLSALIVNNRASASLTDQKLAQMAVSQTDALISALAKGSHR